MTQLNKVLYRVTKPARYTGGEWNSIVKDWDRTALKIALAYPDLYEIGMSNMALPILYDLFNRQPDVLAERVFAPWGDMAAALRMQGVSLFGLESKRPLQDFDVIGFSLGYELTYTNVLNMLDLARIPLLAKERDESYPLVIAGGSGALNPEPMADFFDCFVVGEGEEAGLELLDFLRARAPKRVPRGELLRQMATIPGVYVPGLYEIEYQTDGLLKAMTPLAAEAKPMIQRRLVSRLPPPVTRPVVPYIEVVHDRGAVEIQRGCSRGCRFCQAGSIYRPVRERSHQEILQAVDELIANCGYDEVSLVSLSTSDYHGIDALVSEMARRYQSRNLAVSLPSLRIDSSSVKLVDALPARRKTGLTLAPEAGSPRMQCVINKVIPEEDLMQTAAAAFARGWMNLKLYFMLGLPGETMEDVEGIARLVQKVNALGRDVPGRRPQLRVSVSTFVPKPHTPFQWAAQDTAVQIEAKQEVLRQGLRRRSVKLSWSDPRTSLLEAVLSRGDRRLGRVIHRAWQLGATFDAWNECFDFDKWRQALAECDLDPAFYAYRQRSLDELLPWGHIDAGVTTGFLKREYQRSLKGEITPDCRCQPCSTCGLQRWQAECRQKLISMTSTG
ncbi:MAG: TIGR03960 family B12-binding radical SAM protein [Chloroflexi bacterium]|nr:TIGR03960 family B12-binding radical SAM protein [Chloroflexota bacterium]